MHGLLVFPAVSKYNISNDKWSEYNKSGNESHFFRFALLLLLLLQIINSGGEHCSIHHISATIKQAFQVDFFSLEFVTHEFATAIYVLIFMFIRQKFYIGLYANTLYSNEKQAFYCTMFMVLK